MSVGIDLGTHRLRSAAIPGDPPKQRSARGDLAYFHARQSQDDVSMHKAQTPSNYHHYYYYCYCYCYCYYYYY